MIAAVVVPGPTSTGPSPSSRSTTCAAMLACADASAGAVRALPPCTSRAATGTCRYPCSRGEMVPARRSASSTSITSAGAVRVTRARHEVAGQLARPARRHAEDGRVHLHAGRDADHRHRGRRRRARMSTAVPSPPANSSRSTPASTSAIAAARVSSAVVARQRRRDGRAGEVGAHRAARRQDLARPARIAADRHPRALGRDQPGAAASAASTSARSSEPLRARRPPIPASGFTISPSFGTLDGREGYPCFAAVARSLYAGTLQGVGSLQPGTNERALHDVGDLPMAARSRARDRRDRRRGGDRDHDRAARAADRRSRPTTAERRVEVVRQQTDELAGIGRINDSGVRILHAARALRKVAVGQMTPRRISATASGRSRSSSASSPR